MWNVHFDVIFFLPSQIDSWIDCKRIIWQDSSSTLFGKVLKHFKNQKTDQRIWDTRHMVAKNVIKFCKNIFVIQLPRKQNLNFPLHMQYLFMKVGPCVSNCSKLFTCLTMLSAFTLTWRPRNFPACCWFNDKVLSVAIFCITKRSVDVIWARIRSPVKLHGRSVGKSY